MADATPPKATAEPDWLRLFCAHAPPLDVVAAWLAQLRPEEMDDPQAARSALRVAIVDAKPSCAAVCADADSGWKYTGSIIRAFEKAPGLTTEMSAPSIGPQRVTALGHLVDQAAPSGDTTPGEWRERTREMATPVVDIEPLDPALLAGWQAELASAAEPESRARQWPTPSWHPLEAVSSDSLLGGTIEQVLRLSGALGGEVRARAVGAEFWTQRVSPHKPCKLHWDADELLGQSAGRLETPLMSSIVYVGDEGGPTVMVGRGPADALAAHAAWRERCWLSWPHAGQVAVFPGEMLHGVLPLAAARPSALRQTVLINLWARRPHELRTLPPHLMPRLPTVTDAAAAPATAAVAASEAAAAVATGEAASPVAAEESHQAACGRPAVVRGHVRTRRWAPSEVQRWGETEVDLGMFYGWSRWALRLPPRLEYRRAQLEEFETTLRCVAPAARHGREVTVAPPPPPPPVVVAASAVAAAAAGSTQPSAQRDHPPTIPTPAAPSAVQSHHLHLRASPAEQQRHAFGAVAGLLLATDGARRRADVVAAVTAVAEWAAVQKQRTLATLLDGRRGGGGASADADAEADAARLRAGVLRDLVGLLSRDRVEIDEELFEAHLAMRARAESLGSPEEGAGGVEAPATLPMVARQDTAPPRPPRVHLRCGLVEPADGPLAASPGIVLTLYH